MTGFPPAFIRIPDHMLETFARVLPKPVCIRS